MKKTVLPFILTGLLILTSSQLRAGDTPAETGADANAGNRPGRGANREKMRAKLLEKFDANHNGKLDPDELEKAKEFIKQKREEFAQKHPELAKKMEEKRAAMKEQRQNSGGANANSNAQKTSASPDGAKPSAADIQKAVDSFNQAGSVKL